jgi:hypothetical protein
VAGSDRALARFVIRENRLDEIGAWDHIDIRTVGQQ